MSTTSRTSTDRIVELDCLHVEVGSRMLTSRIVPGTYGSMRPARRRDNLRASNQSLTPMITTACGPPFRRVGRSHSGGRIAVEGVIEVFCDISDARRGKHVVEVPKGMIDRKRLDAENVDRGSRNRARCNRSRSRAVPCFLSIFRSVTRGAKRGHRPHAPTPGVTEWEARHAVLFPERRPYCSR